MTRSAMRLKTVSVAYRPILEDASVKEFKVVLLPDEGLPTKPIKGSRGMFLGAGSVLAGSWIIQ